MTAVKPGRGSLRGRNDLGQRSAYPMYMATPGRLALKPRHPERICWGCSRYCPVDDMVCGNGTIRAPHPIELFGEDWYVDGDTPTDDPQDATTTSSARG